MTTPPPAPLRHDDALTLLTDGLSQQDLAKVLLAAPVVNWMKVCRESLENRPAAPGAGCVLAAFAPDFGQDPYTTIAEDPVEILPPDPAFVRAALDAMVASGFRLLDDPHFERDMGHPHLGPLLLEAAVRHNLTDSYQRTIVHLAITERLPRHQLVRQALAAGADPNARDEFGRTPLEHMWLNNRFAPYAEESHAAVFADVYCSLLEHGADEALTDAVGRSMREVMLLGLSREGPNAHGIGMYAASFEEARSKFVALRQEAVLDASVPHAARPGSPRM